MDPPELPVAQLVRLTGLFGISENRARVALSRMVAAGEATSDGAGRYRLAGHLAARQSRQSASRSGVTSPYDGAVVAGRGDHDGQHGRGARCPSPGTGLRPAGRAARGRVDAARQPRRPAPRRPGRGRRAHDGATRRIRSALSARLWDLPALVGPSPLAARGSRVPSYPDGPEALAPASSSRRPSCGTCRRIRSCRPELLPAAWPGAQLRTAYDDWDATYRTTLREWSREG